MCAVLRELAREGDTSGDRACASGRSPPTMGEEWKLGIMYLAELGYPGMVSQFPGMMEMESRKVGFEKSPRPRGLVVRK